MKRVFKIGASKLAINRLSINKLVISKLAKKGLVKIQSMRNLTRLISVLILLPFSVTVFSVEKSSLENLEERRLALVLGNSKYDGLDDLPNVKNDTDLISAKLKALGFQTKVVLNSSRKEMLSSIQTFGAELDDNDVGLFYYAGHAVQQGASNYLIPSENSSEIDKSTLEFDAVDLNRVVAQMRDAESNINIIILDACRDNPFKDTAGARGLGHTKGLAAPTVNVKGMYIAYSTSPGSVAADGDRNNSPFTDALANYIDQPGLGINEIFTKVRSDVIEQTNNKQVPWEMSSLTADFYFSDEQSKKEKSNELKIEAEIVQLKEMLKQEREAKVTAEKERQKALVSLKENQNNLALIEQQKQTELRKARLEQERIKKEADRALAAERNRKQQEPVFSKQKQAEVEVEKYSRFATVIGEKTIEEKQKLKQEELALAKQEQLELKEATKAKLAEIKLAERELAKQQKQHLKNEAKKALEAEQKRKQQELAIAEQKELELKQANDAKLAQEREAENLANEAAELSREADRLAKQAAKIAKAEAKRIARKEKLLAAQEKARLKKLQAEQLAEEKEAAKVAKAEEKRKAREQKLFAIQEEIKLKKLQAEQKMQAAEYARNKDAREEQERIARQKQLVSSLMQNCDSLAANSAVGFTVLSCYREVLSHDETNSGAITGIIELEQRYQAEITKSIAQKRIKPASRQYAVLEAINPVSTQEKFGALIQSLHKELSK